MVKVKGPLFSLSAFGTLGRSITFRRSKDGPIVEKRPVPSYKRTEAQGSHRTLFQQGASAWGGLTSEEKLEYEVMGDRDGLTGYNCYIREYLLAGPGPPPPTIPLIIFDSDQGADPDDAAAISILNHLADLGECEIIASNSWGDLTVNAQCHEVALAYYGRTDVPIGINKSDVHGIDWWATEIVAYFNALRHITPPFPDAIAVNRQALIDSPNGSVTFVVVGSPTNLYNLYNSPPDGISPLTGSQLLALKIKEIVIMGGDYPVGIDEYNFIADPAGTQVVNSLVDIGVKVVYVGFSIGMLVLYYVIGALTTSYVYRAQLYSPWGWYNHCWDSMAVLYAVRGLEHEGTPYYGVTTEGKNTVDITGDNTWVPGPYNQWYLTLAMSVPNMKALLEALFKAPPL